MDMSKKYKGDIDWDVVAESWKKWEDESVKAPYWEELLSVSKRLLEIFEIKNDNFNVETILLSGKLRDMVLEDLYNLADNKNSLLENEMQNILIQNLISSDVINEMLEEFFLFAKLIRLNFFNKNEPIHQQIQSRYLFHSIYSKIDILKFKHQSMFSMLELEVDDENFEIIRKIENIRTQRYKLLSFNAGLDKFVVSDDRIAIENKGMLETIAKLRNEEAHLITDSEKRMHFYFQDGNIDSYMANYKSVPIWLTFAYILVYSEFFNKNAHNEFKKNPKRFTHYRNGDYIIYPNSSKTHSN